MGDKELADAVARIAELDAKRTQGEWWHKYADGSGPDMVTCGDKVNRNAICSTAWPEGIRVSQRHMRDASFIAAAPQMASIIAQQDAIIQQQREVMRQAREALDKVAHDLAVPLYLREIAGLSIAALDAALKGSE